MKRYSIYIIATFAAIASLASCSKEPALVPEDGGLLPQEQTREIAVSFGVSTKTTLNSDDGITPEFLADDVIKVSNATLSEDCTVKNIGGSLKIITRLSGTLTAVYPSTAANMSGIGNAPIKASPELPYKVSSTQSGLFKDANICTASISEGSTSATFNNVTPLLKFYVDESIGVQSLTIISTENIASDGGGKTITVAPAGGALIHTVTGGNPDPRLCYIAILPNVNANTLAYTSITTVQGQGTVTSTMTSDKTLEANHIYKAFIPYYIKVQVGTDDYQKWAYCNVGAFLPEDPGSYFPWAGTTGYIYKDNKWVNANDRSTELSGGFTNANAPYNNNGADTDYSKYASGISVLELVDDAANDNWGEKWRMPTKEEVLALYIASGGTGGSMTPSSGGSTSTNTKGIWWCEVSDDVSSFRSKGCLLHNGTTGLFFPITGYGDGTALNWMGPTDYYGQYWLSTHFNDNSKAYAISFSSATLHPNGTGTYRRYGFAVRAVYDEGPGVINGGYEDAGSY